MSYRGKNVRVSDEQGEAYTTSSKKARVSRTIDASAAPLPVMLDPSFPITAGDHDDRIRQ